MDQTRALRKAKTELTIFRIFKIIGILSIIFGFLIIAKSFMEYVGNIMGAGSNQVIFEYFFEYMTEMVKNSLVLDIGIVLTIVFSILTSNRKKKVKQIKSELQSN